MTPHETAGKTEEMIQQGFSALIFITLTLPSRQIYRISCFITCGPDFQK